MRRLILLLSCIAVPAFAGGDKTEKAKPIDIKPVIDKLEVFHDDLGNYYVTPRVDTFKDGEDANEWLFYGDGKVMYQQRVIGSSMEPPDHREWILWAPRARSLTGGSIDLNGESLSVQCKVKDGRRPLTQLKADEVKAFVQRAKFMPPLWTRQSHFLARDDDATYYFVDVLREEAGGNGYRVFVGAKGAMKELPMLNMAHDSAGEIFATKTGQLKIVANKDGKAYWVKGDKKIELTVLAPADNKYLIYRELGIYGSLGAICDDL